MAEILKDRLARNHLTQTWLIHQLEKAGIITNKVEMSDTLRGTRRGGKSEKIIATSDAILNKYEEVFK